MRVVYVRGRSDWHNLKWSPKKKWYGPSLVLGKLQEIFWWQKAKWPADPEYLMRLTYVADSWCWYDLKQPTALELTFDVSAREKNCGKVLDLSWTLPKLLTVCLCPAPQKIHDNSPNITTKRYHISLWVCSCLVRVSPHSLHNRSGVSWPHQIYNLDASIHLITNCRSFHPLQ